MRRIRNFFLLLCLLCAGPVRADSGKELLEELPADSTLLLSVDVKGVKKSEIFKTWWQETQKDPERHKRYKSFVKKVGFDPLQMVDTLVLGVTIAPGPPQFMILLQGKIKKKQLFRTIKKQVKKKLRKKKYKGVEYLVDERPGGPTALGWYEGAVAMAPESILKATIKSGARGGPMGNAALRRLVKGASKNAEVWSVAVLPETISTGPKAGPMGMLKSAREVYFRARLESGVHYELVAVAPDNGVAQGMLQALNLLRVSMISNPQIQANPALFKHIQRIVMRVDGNQLVASLELDAKHLQEIVAAVASKLEGQVGGPTSSPPRVPRKGPLPPRRPTKP